MLTRAEIILRGCPDRAQLLLRELPRAQASEQLAKVPRRVDVAEAVRVRELETTQQGLELRLGSRPVHPHGQRIIGLPHVRELAQVPGIGVVARRAVLARAPHGVAPFTLEPRRGFEAVELLGRFSICGAVWCSVILNCRQSACRTRRNNPT